MDPHKLYLVGKKRFLALKWISVCQNQLRIEATGAIWKFMSFFPKPSGRSHRCLYRHQWFELSNLIVDFSDVSNQFRGVFKNCSICVRATCVPPGPVMVKTGSCVRHIVRRTFPIRYFYEVNCHNIHQSGVNYHFRSVEDKHYIITR